MFVSSDFATDDVADGGGVLVVRQHPGTLSQAEQHTGGGLRGLTPDQACPG
jgi:hypothetical protein